MVVKVLWPKSLLRSPSNRPLLRVVPAPLALDDFELHAFGVDVLSFEVGCFAQTQASRVQSQQNCSVFQKGHTFDESIDFFLSKVFRLLAEVF